MMDDRLQMNILVFQIDDKIRKPKTPMNFDPHSRVVTWATQLTNTLREIVACSGTAASKVSDKMQTSAFSPRKTEESGTNDSLSTQHLFPKGTDGLGAVFPSP